MKILSLESSAGPASVAFSEEGRIRAAQYQDVGSTHSRTLLPLCESMLSNAGLSYADADLIAVSAGPGSFTGVRIGIATAKGIAFGTGAKCLAVSSLLGLAANCADLEGELLCPCADARCGRVYTALFRVEGGFPRRLAEDQILPLSALADFCPAPPMLLGDAAGAALAALPGARLAPLALRTHHAVGIARAAAHFAADAVESDLLVPVYLQKSQAEQTRLDAEKKNTKEI